MTRSLQPTSLLPPAPFVRWVGGSQRTLNELLARCPADVAERRYVDPFVGGGALFWALRPRRALLSDVCEPLIWAWRAVAWQQAALVSQLEYQTRARGVDAAAHARWYANLARRITEPVDRSAVIKIAGEGADIGCYLERGAMMIALNRSAYNGLWRENREGRYNVAPDPASLNRDLVRADLLSACSEVLRACDVSIVARSWEATVSEAGAGDFVYADPPYDQEGDEGGQPSLIGGPPAVEGHRYTAAGWKRADLVRLADALAAARDRGAFVIATNNATAFVVDLYAARGFRCDIVLTQRSVSCDKATRGAVGELIAVGAT